MPISPWFCGMRTCRPVACRWPWNRWPDGNRNHTKSAMQILTIWRSCNRHRPIPFSLILPAKMTPRRIASEDKPQNHKCNEASRQSAKYTGQWRVSTRCRRSRLTGMRQSKLTGGVARDELVSCVHGRARNQCYISKAAQSRPMNFLISRIEISH
jgi:hypothetical protein